MLPQYDCFEETLRVSAAFIALLYVKGAQVAVLLGMGGPNGFGLPADPAMDKTGLLTSMATSIDTTCDLFTNYRAFLHCEYEQELDGMLKPEDLERKKNDLINALAKNDDDPPAAPLGAGAEEPDPLKESELLLMLASDPALCLNNEKKGSEGQGGYYDACVKQAAIDVEKQDPDELVSGAPEAGLRWIRSPTPG